jgi:hypothetical protein
LLLESTEELQLESLVQLLRLVLRPHLLELALELRLEPLLLQEEAREDLLLAVPLLPSLHQGKRQKMECHLALHL